MRQNVTIHKLYTNLCLKAITIQLIIVKTYYATISSGKKVTYWSISTVV